MDVVKGFCTDLRTTPMTRIKTTWSARRARPSPPRRSFTPAPAPRYASLVLSFVILLLGLIAADENEHNLNNGNKGAGFAAIWTTFVLVAVAAAGTSLLRSPAKSPLGVGALLGAVVMLSQMMLTLFAVFIGLARENEEDDAVDDAGTNDADRGLAAFYFGDANLRASQYFAERLGPDRRGWYPRAVYREISKTSDIPRRIESSKTWEMF